MPCSNRHRPHGPVGASVTVRLRPGGPVIPVIDVPRDGGDITALVIHERPLVVFRERAILDPASERLVMVSSPAAEPCVFTINVEWDER